MFCCAALLLNNALIEFAKPGVLKPHTRPADGTTFNFPARATNTRLSCGSVLHHTLAHLFVLAHLAAPSADNVS
jgi:hypothetical protein